MGQVANPNALLKELQQGLLTGKVGDESTHRILKALALFDQGLDVTFAPLLQLIGLHRRFVDRDVLEGMIQSAGWKMNASLLDRCITALQVGGLLHPLGQNIYTMHPALVGHLMQCHPAGEEARRGFTDVMGSIADGVAPKEIYEQKPVFHLFGASFHQALDHAKDLEMHAYVGAIMQSLAAYAQHNLEYDSASQLFEEFADYEKAQGWEKNVAAAYHQLGTIAREQLDFPSAEQWYKKSLEIKERLGNEHGAAKTYHQLGFIAEEQREFLSAEQWYKKSLEISERLGNEHGAAKTYEQWGQLHQSHGDLTTAIHWQIKAMVGFANTHDERSLGVARMGFIESLQMAEEPARSEMLTAWEQAGLGKWASQEQLLDAMQQLDEKPP